MAQTLLSLSNSGNVLDYVGPRIDDKEYIDLYNHIYILSKEHIWIRRVWYLLHGITNGGYHSWKTLRLDIEGYDAIILESTKLDYIIEKIGNKKLYIRVHNVEHDYAKKDFLMGRSLTKWMLFILAKRQEKALVERADILVTLTKEDSMRLKELYPNISRKRIKVIPVCVKSKKTESYTRECTNKLQMLITGSLWFGGNYTGIIWFINNVVPKLNIPFELTIAGSHPSPQLLELMQNNIQLIDSPQSMVPYFESSDLILAPIFQGAGMKVKIAEALSFGKPIVGTTHAFIGYDIQDRTNSYVANSSEEFCKAIETYYKLSKDEKNEMSKAAYNLFVQNYSLDKSGILWKQIIYEKMSYDKY